MRLLRIPLPAAFLALTLTSAAFASVVGSVRGIIHDPQHRPVQNAMVMLKAKSSDWSTTANSDANGNFAFNAVPTGEYIVTVVGVGFEQAQQEVAVLVRHAARASFRAQRRGRERDDQRLRHSRRRRPPIPPLQPQWSIASKLPRTPGADRYQQPGHDHRLSSPAPTSPTTSCTFAADIRPAGSSTAFPCPTPTSPPTSARRFDPKDIDYLEVSRGSYGAELGDRTYGVFNVVPRTGFERNREAELVLSAGNFYQTNDQFSIGSHTERFAYYASVNGNRSNLGIQTPVPQVVHDAANGYGGFGSLIFNVDPVEPASPGHLAAQGLLPDPLRLPNFESIHGKIRSTTAAACATATTNPTRS